MVVYAAMDLDKLLITIHILAAVAWVGGAFISQIYAIRAQAAGPVRLGGLLEDIEWVGTRVFLPASLTALATGIWMITRDIWTMEGWVVFGLVVLLLSAAVGSTFLGPESTRIKNLIAANGADDPQTLARINRIFLVSRIELVLLILVVIDMSWKPGV
jgi:uncharacterized membrane protein